jgi:6-phosphofructokinase 1
MRIGILTGGGDVPGLNPCIRSVVLSADDLGWSVLGFRRGWEGVMAIDPADPASIAAHTLPLDREAVRGIDRVGGTSCTPPAPIPGRWPPATAPPTSCTSWIGSALTPW